MAALKNLAGLRFGRLVVLNQHTRRNKKTFWKCKCDCGKEVEVYSYYLTSGHTKSCGCFRQEIARQHANTINKDPNHIKDITGQKFGKLTAISPTSERQGRCVIWYCICECGNFKKVSLKDLQAGNVQSCGCLHSKGEAKITSLLQDNNIFFEAEKSFETCKEINSNRKLRFDFYVNNLYLIEYDGEQHFFCDSKGWNNEDHLKMVRRRDAFKNKWCKENNIPLIRIPYTHYNNLCLEDLLLETSKFIYK